jgi:hypothetical protein
MHLRLGQIQTLKFVKEKPALHLMRLQPPDLGKDDATLLRTNRSFASMPHWWSELADERPTNFMEPPSSTNIFK